MGDRFGQLLFQTCFSSQLCCYIYIYIYIYKSLKKYLSILFGELVVFSSNSSRKNSIQNPITSFQVCLVLDNRGRTGEKKKIGKYSNTNFAAGILWYFSCFSHSEFLFIGEFLIFWMFFPYYSHRCIENTSFRCNTK